MRLACYFNPRSREGSDRQAHNLHEPKCDFNPRSREGSDTTWVFGWKSIGISIHAPVKGATLIGTPTRPGIINFNPRSREGSDWSARRRCTAKRYFNPRSREGSDRIEFMARIVGMNFNPRSREGSDPIMEMVRHPLGRFQSTLP